MSISILERVEAHGLFVHQPLDHKKPSIRLIQIQSELSDDGHIQCHLRQATIHDQYICISYVWGSEDRGNFILLDGHRFWARSNLCAFLNAARSKSQLVSQWLWVDALCIDQSTTAERNHQVQQMGQIYSSAQYVVSWLGESPRIAEFFHKTSRRLPDIGGFKQFRLAENWTRAWITQEIVLATYVIFMAGNAELDGREMPTSYRSYCPDAGVFDLLNTQTAQRLRNRTLMDLLSTFKDKLCADPHDRVFSLLSLCHDYSDIKVDYSLSLRSTAYNILASDPRRLCLCSYRILDSTFGLTTHMVRPISMSSRDEFRSSLIALTQQQGGTRAKSAGVSQLENCKSSQAVAPPFAKITLPVVRSREHESPFVLQRDSRKTVYYHLWLNHVCWNAGHSIEFRIRKHACATQETTAPKRSNEIYGPDGWSIKPSSDGHHCTIWMSFDLIAALANLGNVADLKCCPLMSLSPLHRIGAWELQQASVTRMRICNEREWNNVAYNVGVYRV